jgi:hypothetical protein
MEKAMQTTPADSNVPSVPVVAPHIAASAVSWGAILAGAAAAAALSLILLILGVGLGLSSVSPWADRGVDAGTLGVSTILWITLTSVAAAGLGGYLTGRLRNRWLSTHSDEVYFRDTAHGLLTWAVATLTTAALLTSSISSIVSGGVKAGAQVAASTANTVGATAAALIPATTNAVDGDGNMAYYLDSLFRSSASAPNAQPRDAASTDDAAAVSMQDTRINNRTNRRPSALPIAEAGRIFVKSLSSGAMAEDDLGYLGQQVARRTQLSQQEAETRVRNVYARLQQSLADAELAAKTMADKARKASAYTALWLFISLLGGAFVASLSATYGGRQRDL